MPTIALKDIKVGARQRKEVDNQYIQELSESIDKWGLLNPILLDRDHYLIAGFCRMSAHFLLDREEISFNYSDEVSEEGKKILELEENIRRKDLEFWEEALAILEIHDMKQAEDSDWTQLMTANYVGRGHSTVSKALHIAREYHTAQEQGDDSVEQIIKEAKTSTGAVQRMEKKHKIAKRKKEIALRSKGVLSDLRAEILQGDAYERIQELEDESIDAIITNPPFGVDLEFKGFNPYGDISDDNITISDLLRAMAPEMYRVLRDDSWLVSFFDVKKITYNEHFARLQKLVDDLCTWVLGTEPPKNILEQIAEVQLEMARAHGLAGWLEEAGFSVNLIPAIWVKPNKTQGTIRNPNAYLVVAYEAFLFASKGDPVFMRNGRQNIFIYDTPASGERIFSLQMPADLNEELVGLVCPGGSTILDPFAGSGSIGVGAIKKQCHFIGFELDEGRADDGNMLLKEELYGREEEAE